MRNCFKIPYMSDLFHQISYFFLFLTTISILMSHHLIHLQTQNIPVTAPFFKLNRSGHPVYSNIHAEIISLSAVSGQPVASSCDVFFVFSQCLYSIVLNTLDKQSDYLNGSPSLKQLQAITNRKKNLKPVRLNTNVQIPLVQHNIQNPIFFYL